jgi:hypothetical protein
LFKQKYGRVIIMDWHSVHGNSDSAIFKLFRTCFFPSPKVSLLSNNYYKFLSSNYHSTVILIQKRTNGPTGAQHKYYTAYNIYAVQRSLGPYQCILNSSCISQPLLYLVSKLSTTNEKLFITKVRYLIIHICLYLLSNSVTFDLGVKHLCS